MPSAEASKESTFSEYWPDQVQEGPDAADPSEGLIKAVHGEVMQDIEPAETAVRNAATEVVVGAIRRSSSFDAAKQILSGDFTTCPTQSISALLDANMITEAVSLEGMQTLEYMWGYMNIPDIRGTEQSGPIRSEIIALAPQRAAGAVVVASRCTK